MHSSRMRTARSLPYGRGLCVGGSLFRGVSVRETRWTEIPPPTHTEAPWTEIPPHRDPLHRDHPWPETPQTEIPPCRDPPTQRLPFTETPLDRGTETPLDRDPSWMETPRQRPRPPPGQTDTCENTTFANFVCGR